jgi:cephalosporin-C deacetylase-like acetyl esterase
MLPVIGRSLKRELETHMMQRVGAGLAGLFAVSAFAFQSAPAVGPAEQPRHQVVAYLNAIGQSQLQERARAMADVRTRTDAESRKQQVRKKIVDLIGGLPDFHGPLNTRQFGTVTGEGFRVERVAYESLPGFIITANVYVPTSQSGPFPAVVLSAGHGADGKLSQYSFGANLARNSIIALAWDPLGQGERFQNYDPELGASKAGETTGEHGHANVQTELLGEHVSRYFIWDGVRSIDYLASRKDVDANRIGAFGCSGGGTMTTYLAAFDARVKAAAPACYITSFPELLPTAGPQEGEQSIPNFLKEGLDFGDWVELAAPIPYAIVSTTNDMFPFEGARQTYEEAKRIWALYGAGDRVTWLTGPGGHGALGSIYPEILAFFVRYLKNTDEKPTYTPLRPVRREDLLCTPTGQLSTSIGSETVHTLNVKRAQDLLLPKTPLKSKAELDRFQSRLREDVRALAAISANAGSTPPRMNVVSTDDRAAYRLDTVSFQSEPGIDVSGVVAVPKRGGARPALLLMDSQARERLVAPGGDLDRLAIAGWVVFLFQPRLIPAGTEYVQSAILAPFNLLSLRAAVVGKNIVGMRVDDTFRAVDWLCSRPEVDRAAVTAVGRGPLGVVLLHAAALDPRIHRVLVQNTLASYRFPLEQPLTKDMPEILVPRVLRKYDLGDLMLAISPRSLSVINPVDAVGLTVGDHDFETRLAYVFESDRNLGSRDRIRLLSLEPRDPLPLE